MESTAADPETQTRLQKRRLIICVSIGLTLSLLALSFAPYDFGAVLCVCIALGSGLLLLFKALVNRGRRTVTFLVLAAYLGMQALIIMNYTLVRDHTRWLLLSGAYQSRVLQQPATGDHQFRHVEWDGWGFAGMDTTTFLAFDPTDSLAAHTGKRPGKVSGLPCEVYSITRMQKQWYAVQFYTETYWGQEACK